MTTPIDANAKSYLDFSGLASLRAKASRDELGAAKEAAQQFEAYFLQEMMKSMRAAVEKSDLFDSSAMDTYQDMMDKEIAQKMASGRGVGLTDMLTRQFTASHVAAKDALAQHAGTAMPLERSAARPLQLEPKAWPLAADRLYRSLK